MKTKLNEQMSAGLKAALGALFALDDAGVTVHDVEIDGGKPVIQVDRIPDDATPAHIFHCTVGRNRSTLRVAIWRGCRLQCETAAPKQMRGAA